MILLFLLKQGNYEEAGQAFQEFLQLYPQQELAGNAAYWLGESYYARKDYQRSAQIFARIKNYPGSSKALGIVGIIEIVITHTISIAFHRISEAWITVYAYTFNSLSCFLPR